MMAASFKTICVLRLLEEIVQCQSAQVHDLKYSSGLFLLV